MFERSRKEEDTTNAPLPTSEATVLCIRETYGLGVLEVLEQPMPQLGSF